MYDDGDVRNGSETTNITALSFGGVSRSPAVCCLLTQHWGSGRTAVEESKSVLLTVFLQGNNQEKQKAPLMR